MNTFIENIKLAFKALWNNKIRSFLTILGVLIGVFAVITMVALISGLKDSIVSEIAGLGAEGIDLIPGKMGQGGMELGALESFASSFSDQDIKVLKGIQGIKYVVEMYQLPVDVSFKNKEERVYLVGAPSDVFKLRDQKTQAGRLYRLDEEGNKVVVLGDGLAKKLFNSPEKAVGRSVIISNKHFEVVGVLEEDTFRLGSFSMNDVVYAPGRTAKDNLEGARINEIYCKVKNKNEVDEIVAEMKKVLKQRRGNDNFTLMTQENMLEMIDRITAQITLALGGIAAISLLVGGIGIMNIMLVSVTERTREIGIRKAIGATDSDILLQFLIEAVVLCLMGGLVGIGVSGGVSMLITKFTGLPTLINLQTVLAAFGFSVFVGIIFGTMPAVKAAKLDPIEALRYE